MTAINLALRGLYGYVLWGNSLALETRLVYRTGFNGSGFVREVSLAACPAPVQQVATESSPSPEAPDDPSAPRLPGAQLRLF